jgi:hypothetical protein
VDLEEVEAKLEAWAERLLKKRLALRSPRRALPSIAKRCGAVRSRALPAPIIGLAYRPSETCPPVGPCGPGLAQVFHLGRQVISKKTGGVREEIVAGMASLMPERANTVRLLALARNHWHIEKSALSNVSSG